MKTSWIKTRAVHSRAGAYGLLSICLFVTTCVRSDTIISVTGQLSTNCFGGRPMVVFSDAYIRFSLSSPTCYPRGVYFGDRLCEIGLHAPCDTNPNATPLEANKEYTAPLLFNPWINGMTCVQDELDVQCTGGEIYDCETFLNISVSEIPIQPPHASLPAALTVNWSGGEPEGSLLVKLGEADICEPPISVEQLLPYFEWHNSMGLRIRSFETLNSCGSWSPYRSRLDGILALLLRLRDQI